MTTLKSFEYRRQNRLMDQSEVAEILCVSKRTLEQWRWQGKGPRYIKIGKLVRYREMDVMEYIEQLAKNGQEVNRHDD